MYSSLHCKSSGFLGHKSRNTTISFYPICTKLAILTSREISVLSIQIALIIMNFPIMDREQRAECNPWNSAIGRPAGMYLHRTVGTDGEDRPLATDIRHQTSVLLLIRAGEIGFVWLCFLRLRRPDYCYILLSYKMLRPLGPAHIGFIFSNRLFSSPAGTGWQHQSQRFGEWPGRVSACGHRPVVCATSTMFRAGSEQGRMD